MDVVGVARADGQARHLVRVRVGVRIRVRARVRARVRVRARARGRVRGRVRWACPAPRARSDPPTAGSAGRGAAG